MSWTVFAIEAIVLVTLFTVAVLGVEYKDPVAGIHDYPPEIQEEYFKTHERIPVEPLSTRTVLIKCAGLALFVVVLGLCARLAGVSGFWGGFWYAVALFVIVGAWDTFVLDWVVFARWKAIRLPGTEHMDKEYAQKWFHLKGILFPGSLYALVLGVVTGAITALL